VLPVSYCRSLISDTSQQDQLSGKGSWNQIRKMTGMNWGPTALNNQLHFLKLSIQASSKFSKCGKITSSNNGLQHHGEPGRVTEKDPTTTKAHYN